MKTIWKFTLEAADRQVINPPIGSQILCVQEQHGAPCIWMLCDPEKERELRVIEIVGTGHELDERDRMYIGTVQLSGGALVFHAFENSVL
jgi:hypothetical protein